MPSWFSNLILLGGLGQLGIVVVSLSIPKVLGWPKDVAQLKPLTQQVFWTYAGYIWFTNLAFGLISVLAPMSLLDQSFLAAAVSSFITIYWAARIVIQFTYFDRTETPEGLIFKVAEVVLVSLFLFFTATYGYSAAYNLWGSP